ncbi:hypothetical protein HGM15179_020599, partial [Zosterops borbonicus]
MGAALGEPLCRLCRRHRGQIGRQMSFNQIEKVNELKKVKSLRRLNLSHNKINNLQGLEGHELLELINLEENQVAELEEIKWMGDLPLLRVVNLLKNPVQEQDGYWLSAIFTLLQVTDLDLKKVSVKEKVDAVNRGDPPPEVVAAEDHRIQILYNMPSLIMIYFGLSVPSFNGKFLATYKYSGHLYGLGRDTVEAIGVYSLKNTHFRPRYVLVVPMDKGKYEERLRRSGLFSRAEMEEAVARVDKYLQKNQDFPGYFDAVINGDDLDEAFRELTQLVKVYLGLEPPEVLDNTENTKSRAGKVPGSRIFLLI